MISTRPHVTPTNRAMITYSFEAVGLRGMGVSVRRAFGCLSGAEGATATCVEPTPEFCSVRGGIAGTTGTGRAA